MTAKSIHDGDYLWSAVEACYPTDPSAFRAIYQRPNPRVPEYRLEGLASMTDDDLIKLAAALQLACIKAPEKINELWSAVCTQGWLVSRLENQ